MDFVLVKSAELPFPPKGTPNGATTSRSVNISVDNLGQVAGSVVCGYTLQKLEALLRQQPSATGKRRRLSEAGPSELTVELSYGGPVAGWTLQVFDRNQDPEGLLIRLVRACRGAENLKAAMSLRVFTAGFGAENMWLNFKDVRVLMTASKPSVALLRPKIVMTSRCTENMLLEEKWSTRRKLTGRLLNLTLTLNDAAFDSIFKGDAGMGETGSVNRKLLETANASGNVVIVAENGVEVRCHKMFLTAQSAVFQAMFQSNMREKSSGTVKMPDLTEAGVRALVAYLYCKDIGAGVKSSATACELLMAADKYEISGLYDAMQEIILQKESGWFGVSAAVRIFLLGNHRKGDINCEKLKKKAVNVLKSKGENALKGSEEFLELFRHPETGRDMCLAFITKFPTLTSGHLSWSSSSESEDSSDNSKVLKPPTTVLNESSADSEESDSD